VCLFTAALLALTGCQARSTVRLDVKSDGSGTVAVIVRMDKEAADALPNLKNQLQTTDLVHAGWTVVGPSDISGGGKQVIARHGFGSPQEATALLNQLSGNGAPFAQFQLTQHRSLFHVTSTFTGSIDMRQGVNSFGDLGLTQSVGSKLGFDPNELQKSLGVDWPGTFPVDVIVNLPGGNNHHTPDVDDQGVWHATYGQSTDLHASAAGWNTRPLLFFGGSIASVLVLMAVLFLWKVDRYQPRHGIRVGSEPEDG
jgi:hypothetical protein